MDNQHPLTFIHEPYLAMMMMLSQQGHMTNVYGFISASLNPIIARPAKMVNQYALIPPCSFAVNDDIMSTRLPAIGYKQSGLCFPFQKPSNKQSWQDCRPAYHYIG